MLSCKDAMRKQRPVVVSIVIWWFFAFYAIGGVADAVNVLIKLGEAFAQHGIGSFNAEFNASVKKSLFWSLGYSVLLMTVLLGLWRMRRWGLYGFSIFLCYYLLKELQLDEPNLRRLIIYVGSFIACWYSFSFTPRKKSVERPEAHLYEGAKPRAAHEPKSALEDLIY